MIFTKRRKADCPTCKSNLNVICLASYGLVQVLFCTECRLKFRRG